MHRTMERTQSDNCKSMLSNILHDLHFVSNDKSKFRMKHTFLFVILLLSTVFTSAQDEKPKYIWGKLSTAYGDVDLLLKGKEQPALIVGRVLGKETPEIIVTEKTESPSVVMYSYKGNREWDSYVIEKRATPVGEGIATGDVDGDGDIDIVAGSNEGKEIWWWENPGAENISRMWRRNYIKRTGSSGHRDMVMADFDNDKKEEIAFWSENTLYLAKRPEDDAIRTTPWPLTELYTYDELHQAEQRTNGSVVETGVNTHAGAYAADINLDGVPDLLAGGRYFYFKAKEVPVDEKKSKKSKKSKKEEVETEVEESKPVEGKYICKVIDESYIGGTIAAGQIIAGGMPEIVIGPNHGAGPIMMYQCKDGESWEASTVYNKSKYVHSLSVVNFDNDSLCDIVIGETFNNENSSPRMFLLLNKGDGTFMEVDVVEGRCAHGLTTGDLDGDGDYDIVVKPYSQETPRLDIWMNNGVRKKVFKYSDIKKTTDQY